MDMMEAMADSGIVIIDKPPGLTSHEVTVAAKKIIGAVRSGHAGTLDPNVSGVLPIAFGRATKLLDYIVSKEKTYVCLMKFRELLEEGRIRKLFSTFEGTITQTPPPISAVRKVPRQRTIHALRILEIDGRSVLFEANVQAGTYIRTLCDDMGKQCGGARMVELRRIAVGGILEGECFTMQDLADAAWLCRDKGGCAKLQEMVCAPERYLASYPKITLTKAAAQEVLNGAKIWQGGVLRAGKFSPGMRVSVWCGDKFVGMGKTFVNDYEIALSKKPVCVMERVHARKGEI
jgi:H/ACA ribonucleoprotein complex subunit 4